MKLGPMELVLILVIVLLVFGVGKLPQVGAALGKSIRAFKDGQSGEDEEETARPRRRVKKVARKAKPATAADSAVVAEPGPVAEKAAVPEQLVAPSNN